MNFSKISNIAFGAAMIAAAAYYSVATYDAINKADAPVVEQPSSEVNHTKAQMCLAAGLLFDDLMAVRNEPRMDLEAFIRSRLAQKDMPEHVEAVYDLALRNLASDDETVRQLGMEVVVECMNAN